MLKSERIYVASSWRNQMMQKAIVHLCRAAKMEVYDFTADDGDAAFHWEAVDQDWKGWTVDEYRAGLDHPAAVAGFERDFNAMLWADTMILVMPCGRSAHLELGWACGAEMRTAIWIPPDESFEPELMYRLVDLVTDSTMELLGWLGVDD